MYNDFLTINKNFQYSINLDFDLYNQSKLDEYIPTSDICDVLEFYVDTILGVKKERATTLIGPYGKGKSFLLLVLIQMCSKTVDKKILDNLLSRISIVNNRLVTKIKELRAAKKYLMPVIVNSSYDNLSQSFLIGLKNALDRDGLNDLVPHTSYDVCLGIIKKWKNSDLYRNGKLKKCLEDKKISLNELEQGLKNYSTESYRVFENLYNCVVDGLSFNPMTDTNIVRLFSDVNREINEKGYSGILIIFDEFSKFIESNSPTLHADLKILQDFAEKSTRSKNTEQLHICCITHKVLRQYLRNDNNGEENKELFKTVEGRFKEIRFNRGLNQNYELVGSAIQKSEQFADIFKNFYEKNKVFYESIKSLTFMNDDNIETVLFKNCFPLNPLTVYAIIILSEFIAQNERTLFTFLSDNDENSFNSFVANNNDGLFDLSKVYDYFSPIIKNNESQSLKTIWYRAESCLKRISDVLDRKIVKCLAIIECLSATEQIAATNSLVSLALFVDESIIKEHIDSLVSLGVLRVNVLTNSITFAGYNSKEIDRQINHLLSSKLRNSYWPDIVNNEINRKRFVLPRKYNATFKMTRYFYSVYLDDSEFLDLASFKNLFDENTCDGLIINIINLQSTTDILINKARALNDERVVIRIPNQIFDEVFISQVKKVKAFDLLLQEKEISDVIRSELEISRNELVFDLLDVLDTKFAENNYVQFSTFSGETDVENLLSFIMEKVYPETPIINYELLNKNNVTVQYLKPRNLIINKLINHEDFKGFSETSPEASIYNSVIVKKDEPSIRKILDIIKHHIISSNGKKISIRPCIDLILNKPYGVRKGVIPLLFALAISELNDNLIMYFGNKEIDVDATNLSKIVDARDKISMVLTKKSIEQEKFVSKVILLFGGQNSNSFMDNVKIAADRIKKFILNLPRLSRNASQNLSEKTVKYRNLFLSYDINTYDVIFKESANIFETKSYSKLYENLVAFKDEIESYVKCYSLLVCENVKSLFSITNDESLSNGLKSWLKNNGYQKGKTILDSNYKKIVSFVIENALFDDYECVNELSYISLGSRIEDWDANKDSALLQELQSFKDYVINISQNPTTTKFEGLNSALELIETEELSVFGKMLENNISGALDEFGDSISSEEKIKILAEMIRKLI